MLPQEALPVNKVVDRPTHDIAPYVVRNRKIDPQDTVTYHRSDLPGCQGKKWEWDLRGQERSYLGNYDFDGKRVLEFGPATGGLTFWMEHQGAEIVAIDLSPDVAKTCWDLLVGPEDNIVEMKRNMSWGIERMNNGFWYAHEQLDSNARLVHGTAYNVPSEIGRFDVVTLCSILLHLRDPLGALEHAMTFNDKSIIITDAVPRFIDESLQHLPLAYFTPNKSRRTRHGGRTWWQITAEAYRRFLDLKGFKVISNTSALYQHKTGLRKLYTIVAERL